MRAIAFAVAAVLGSSLALPAAPLTTEERATQLIKQLGSPNYRDREAAFRELDSIGAAALEWLRPAAASPDRETAHRAAELIRRAEERKRADLILAPSTVELAFQDRPVAEAVRDFERATGLPLQIVGNQSALAKRKLTWKSGRVGIWEALAGFTQAAALDEPPATPTPMVPSSEAQWTNLPGGGRRMVIVTHTRASQADVAPHITLRDAAASKRPTCTTGAVRIQALPPGFHIPGVTPLPGEVLVPLQVSLESKISWAGGIRVKSAEAIDDRGQRLVANITAIDSTQPMSRQEMLMAGIVARQPMEAMPRSSALHQFVGLRLLTGAEPSKCLAKLDGTFSLSVRATGEIAAISNPLEAAGQSVRGEYGLMTIHSVQKQANGGVTWDISLEIPRSVHVSPKAGQVAAIAPNNIVIRNGMVVQQQVISPFQQPADEFFGLTLVDAEGKRHQFTGSQSHSTTVNGFDEVHVRFKVATRPNGAGEPTRLVLTAAYPVTVEVPFAFQDLPLP